MHRKRTGWLRQRLFKSLRRRDIIILATFWLSAACMMGLVLVFFALRFSEWSRPVYRLNAGEITARSLFPAAQEAAAAWEADVRFVSASATWNHASLETLEQPVEWIFRFYSPGLQRILFVIVTPDRQVVVRPHLEKTRREFRIVNPDRWQMDSPEALSNWLNNGGAEWLRYSTERIVSAQLTQDLNINAPVWTISGLNPETGDSIVYTVPAVKGQ
ncbi:MAG: hypothetical protein D6784_18395 [Chloroflexi bacterium]|nr:MAG: hypothetical protein D6784_18395 [Chloroflexota bacterium]